MVIIKDCKLIRCIQGITQIEFHICLGGKSRLLFGVIEAGLCETGCNFLVFKGRIILSAAKRLRRCKALRRNESPKCGLFLMFLSTLFHPFPLPGHIHNLRNNASACYLAVESVRINCRHCFLCGLGTQNCSLTFTQVSDKYWKLWQWMWTLKETHKYWENKCTYQKSEKHYFLN